MEVKLAKTAGFCFGVKRAVDMVYEQSDKDKEVYTYGPIIHNEEVVKELKERGVKIIDNEEELKKLKKGTVVIRSHGVRKHIYDICNENNLEIIDATCPFVKKIHRIVEENSAKGNHIVVIGNSSHPEVLGIIGWASGRVTVIENEDEAIDFQVENKKTVCIVSQTTFNYTKFKDLVEIISKKGYDIIVLNTICNATEERQKEAFHLANESDAMIVIGGRNSSNTQKLYGICKKECENTLYIQTLDDLDLNLFKSTSSLGITAGASTPNNIIKEVYNQCQKLVSNNY